jgi:hypothetical protein
MAAAPSTIAGRHQHTAVWTGREMVVWGGNEGTADGAAYDPTADTWRTVASGGPAGKVGHGAAWTGSRMMVWGGSTGTELRNDGAAWDAATNTWSSIAAAPVALVPRRDHIVGWTGSEFLVWGGRTGDASYTATGALYSAATNTWRTMASAPIEGRASPSAGIVSGYLIVLGGTCAAGPCGDAARYDPATDTWKKWSFALPPRAGAATAVRTTTIAAWSGVDASGVEHASGRLLYAAWDLTTYFTPPTSFTNAARTGAVAFFGGTNL